MSSSSSSTALDSALFCASGLAVLIWQRLLRQIEAQPILKKVFPPVAKKVEFQQYFGKHPDRPEEYRGDNVMDPPKSHSDDYQWLRDDSRTNEEVLTHIKAENAYTEFEMSPLAPLTESLYTEMLQYLKESDEEVPYRCGEFEYFSKTVKGLAYTIHCRRAVGTTLPGKEVVILDENALVSSLKCSYLDLGALEPSPSHSLMAYAIDASGYETYDIYLKSIPLGEEKDTINPVVLSEVNEDNKKEDMENKGDKEDREEEVEVLTECGGEAVWGSDDSCLFYTKLDEEHRPHQVWLHLLGTPQEEDVLLFEDSDGLFNVSVSKTLSGECVVISSESIETSEAYVIFLPPPSFSSSSSSLSSTNTNTKTDSGSGVIRKRESQAAHLRASTAKVLVQPREEGLRYDVDHHDKHLLIVTNEGGAKNGKLMRVSLPAGVQKQKQKQKQGEEEGQASLSNKFGAGGDTSVDGGRAGEGEGGGGEEMSCLQKQHWEEVRPYDAQVEITGVLPFQHCVAVFGRAGGGQRVWIYRPACSSDGGGEKVEGGYTWQEVSFSEECYSVNPSQNHMYETDVIRVKYSSMLTPQQVLEIKMTPTVTAEGSGDFTREILKQKEVPGYDSQNYRCCRIFAPSNTINSGGGGGEDAVMIPISLVYHKSLLEGREAGGLPRQAPVLMSGYGSYGCSNDPYFSYSQLPLLDRGVVYAIAHIRGGGEMGRALWYEEGGKYFTKMNTFHDFAACGLYLQQQGVTTKQQMAIVGRSAGGLLIGATINMYPELCQAAVADVPFVDVVNTMADPSIPLTVGEWEEWGNPNEAKYHEYMSKYCPYSNIRKQAYPALLVTAGLFDPRVAYWEPAKFVSKLREFKTDKNLLMMKTDLSSGHFNASDRYKDLRERAFEMSFVLSQITDCR